MEIKVTQLLIDNTINELGISNNNKNTIKLLNLIYYLKHKDSIEKVIRYFNTIKYKYSIKEVIEIVIAYNSKDRDSLLSILSKKDLNPQQVIVTIIVLYNN